jgi:peptidoglycan hydrolase-like protein with peptidoglycan-binding domain
VRVLHEGIPKSPQVKQWQFFLIGQGIPLEGGADGKFGPNTREATESFQAANDLPVTGKVDNTTLAAAMLKGFVLVVERDDDTDTGPNFPRPPDFSPLPNNSARQAMFGKFSFEHDPQPTNRENIRILGGWAEENIVSVTVPQLVGVGIPVAGGTVPSRGKLQFHRKAVPQLLALWAAWEAAGLKDRVITWGGAFMPRLIRGKIAEKALSVHAFGCAFDINMAENALGVEPARVGKAGCVRELVTLANEHGFFWGGHFRDRPDGMHFEIARLL